MVSSLSSKPQQQQSSRRPPLSYADRAKKAQNIKPKSVPIHPHPCPTSQQWGAKSQVSQSSSTSNSMPYSGLSRVQASDDHHNHCELECRHHAQFICHIDTIADEGLIALAIPFCWRYATEAKSSPDDSKGMNGGDISTSTTSATSTSGSTPCADIATETIGECMECEEGADSSSTGTGSGGCPDVAPPEC
jgi:hypothetical protein